jgi:hypothetical protein
LESPHLLATTKVNQLRLAAIDTENEHHVTSESNRLPVVTPFSNAVLRAAGLPQYKCRPRVDVAK